MKPLSSVAAVGIVLAGLFFLSPGHAEGLLYRAQDANPKPAKHAEVSKEIDVVKRHLEEYKAALERANTRMGSLRDELERERAEIKGTITKIDVEKTAISFTLKDTKIAVHNLPLTSDFKVLVRSKGETIDDLKVGMPVAMRIVTSEGKSAISVVRELPRETKKDAGGVISSFKD